MIVLYVDLSKSRRGVHVATEQTLSTDANGAEEEEEVDVGRDDPAPAVIETPV